MTDPVPPPAASPRPPADLNPRTDPPLDFPDRPFGELTPADYHTLGFMAGLEVHQQLATERKLFCRCQSGVRTTVVDAEILRHMRPTLSELGEYDGCALMEFKTKKEIVYLLERSSVCTYEIDDTPPFPINETAVRIALEVSRLFNLNLVSELHVMRKQYLDGSIPTGFQRTAMVGLTGAIPFRGSELGSDRMLRIRQLSLEEDSCREVSDIGHQIMFRTDRLGMPLIETVTEPDLLTPHDVRAGGELLASVARATGKVRRGAGAARQDVNVSVAGGRRVEIKGVSSLVAVPRLVHIEAFRQLNLLRIKAELQRRGVTPEMLSIPDRGVPWQVSDLVLDCRSALRRTEYAPVRDAIDSGDMVAAVKLPQFRGLLGHRTQPGITFASELSGRVRVIACLIPRPFMIHSDVTDYGIAGRHWQQMRVAFRADHDDAMVVLWGAEADVATGAREVLARAREALSGVPSETRQSKPDGTNRFERILPGPDRMYPDTDTPPLPIPDAWVTEIESHMPERPWDRIDRYLSLGLTRPVALRLAAAPWADWFEALAPAAGEVARRLAAACEKRLIEEWRRIGRRELPDVNRFRPLIEAAAARPAVCAAFEHLFTAILRQPDRAAAELIPAKEPAPTREAALAAAVAATVAARDETRQDQPGPLMRWAMGRVMADLRGRVEPAAAARAIAAALDLDLDGGVR